MAQSNRRVLHQAMKTLVLVASLLALAGPAHAQGQGPLELTVPADVEEATALNTGIDRISGKVTACIEGGGDPGACLCRNAAADLVALKGAYDAAIARHPGWRGRVLFFTNADRSRSWNINMPGLEGALSACR